MLVLQGGPEQALRCFGSLAELPDDPSFEVVVVDDASVGLDDRIANSALASIWSARSFVVNRLDHFAWFLQSITIEPMGSSC